MDPSEYERVVAEIAGSVVRRVSDLGPEAVRSGLKNLWRGESQFEHQIDVSVVGADRIAMVECKCWKNRVPAEAVLTFNSRLIDIRAVTELPVEGTLVTTVGFQRGAWRLARHFGIQCEIVRDAEEWSFRFDGDVVVRPRPATVILGTVDPKVRITSPGADTDSG